MQKTGLFAPDEAVNMKLGSKLSIAILKDASLGPSLALRMTVEAGGMELVGP